MPNILDSFIPGKGRDNYYLTFHKRDGSPDESGWTAQFETEDPLTWGEAAKEAIQYCKENNICLAYLCEAGAVRKGPGGNPYYFPDEARKLIALELLNMVQSN